MSRGQRFKPTESEIRSQKALDRGIKLAAGATLFGGGKIVLYIIISAIIVWVLGLLKYIIPIAIIITVIALVIRAMIKKKKYDAEMQTAREKVRKEIEAKEQTENNARLTPTIRNAVKSSETVKNKILIRDILDDYTVIDLETTGLNSQQDEIIEINITHYNIIGF